MVSYLYFGICFMLISGVMNSYADERGKLLTDSSILTKVQDEEDNIIVCTVSNINQEDTVHVLHGDTPEQLSEAVNLLIDEGTDIHCSEEYCMLSTIKAIVRGSLNEENKVIVNTGVSYKSCETGESVSIPILSGKYALYLYKGDWNEFTFDDYTEYDGSLVLEPFTWVSEGIKKNTLTGVDAENIYEVDYFTLQPDNLADNTLCEKSISFTNNFSFVVVNSRTEEVISVGHKK